MSMTHTEIRAARLALRLTVNDFAAMLDTDANTVRKMQQSPNTKTHRKPAPRMVKLIEAWLSGYRPKDWPPQERWLSEGAEDAAVACVEAPVASGGPLPGFSSVRSAQRL